MITFFRSVLYTAEIGFALLLALPMKNILKKCSHAVNAALKPKRNLLTISLFGFKTACVTICVTKMKRENSSHSTTFVCFGGGEESAPPPLEWFRRNGIGKPVLNTPTGVRP